MGVNTTFGAFTTARLGIYASQKALDVTANNITNINTAGYTRQALNQVSLKTGGVDRYTSVFSVPVGTGVLCTGVSQLRDPYLDIRYRNESSSVGAMDAKLAGLEAISAVLDEVGSGDGNGVIEAQFNDFVTQLQNLSNNVGQNEYETMVRSSASTLAQLFNSYSKRLDEVSENASDSYRQDLETVNGLLENIRSLNESIRSSEIHGDYALELKDQRNLLVDQLSQYMKLDVIYSKESIGFGHTVDKLEIRLAGHDGTAGASLIDGIYGADISLKDPGDYSLEISALTREDGQVLEGSVPVDPADADLYGALKASKDILTGLGEYAEGTPDAARGIPYYKKALDALAQQFAAQFNEANSSTDADGNVTGILFSSDGTTDDPSGITAANLSVASGWAAGTTHILSSRALNPTSQDNSNILHMISLMDKKLSYTAEGREYFKGTFQGMLSNINSILANDKKITETMLTNYNKTASDLDTNRDSVSGVDLNDEAANLMQYQKSYTAACRLMTTIDEVLDKLINGTGVVGR